ncbi:MAG: winged helix-turn-helix transcriptional regulator [Candidatus Methanomethylophilaceae archaeon]|nr:winged helix-turn-helix transcriptional regulator [Candidatus Methanomethylophilaceae archaeon]
MWHSHFLKNNERHGNESSVLENKYAISILLQLKDVDYLVKGDLARNLAKGSSTVQARISELVAAGLVTEKRESTKPFKIFVSLTPRGKTVANMLFAIEEFLRDKNDY